MIDSVARMARHWKRVSERRYERRLVRKYRWLFGEGRESRVMKRRSVYDIVIALVYVVVFLLIGYVGIMIGQSLR